MAIRQRNDGLQIDVKVKPEGSAKAVRYRRMFYGSKAEAELREAEVRLALRRGLTPEEPEDPSKPLENHVPTLWDAIQKTEKRRWSKCSQSHLTSTLRRAKLFLDHVGRDKACADFTTEDIEDFVEEFLEPREAAMSTHNGYMSMISAMITENAKLFTQDPEPLFLKGATETRVRLLKDSERTAIFDFMLNDWDALANPKKNMGQDWYDFFVFFNETGIRPITMRDLEVDDYHEGLIHIWSKSQTKRKVMRTIPLTRAADEAWQRQRKRMADAGISKPFAWAKKDCYKHPWAAVRAKLGLLDDDEFVPYILRHDCACRLYKNTRDIYLVKKWMGHASIKTTEIYAKLYPGDMEAARDALEAA